MGCSVAHVNSEIPIFFRNIQIEIQLKFDLDFYTFEFCSELVIEWIWFKHLNSNEEYEFGFQIQVNLIKPFRNTDTLVNSIEIHKNFSRAPKIMKLGPKFIIVLPHHGSRLLIGL
jgi:hypothetical protein